MASMFSLCYELTDIDVSKFNTSKVSHMYYMFNGCKKLTSIDVSNFDISHITSMDSMFRDCESLTSLNLSSFNSTIYDADFMFYNAKNLQTIYAKDTFKVVG